ncbi:MAG: nucleotidyltransferase family protein [Phycisphaerales bacterium]|nr:MAG: nucleotidyltransferase family protein [Phycisphaerales bacterium]
MINAIVLAAGESIRMGKSKPLLRIGDRTFLEQIVAVLQDANVDRITVVLGARAEAIAEAVDLTSVDVVVNSSYRNGQLSSLITGLDNAPAETEAILLCLVDGPFITADIVNQVLATFQETGASIVIPTFEGQRGHPSLFARPLFEQLRNAPPEEGARYVVYANEDKIVEVEIPEKAVVAGINTPEDYRLHFGTDP